MTFKNNISLFYNGYYESQEFLGAIRIPGFSASILSGHEILAPIFLFTEIASPSTFMLYECILPFPGLSV